MPITLFLPWLLNVTDSFFLLNHTVEIPASLWPGHIVLSNDIPSPHPRSRAQTCNVIRSVLLMEISIIYFLALIQFIILIRHWSFNNITLKMEPGSSKESANHAIVQFSSMSAVKGRLTWFGGCVPQVKVWQGINQNLKETQENTNISIQLYNNYAPHISVSYLACLDHQSHLKTHHPCSSLTTLSTLHMFVLAYPTEHNTHLDVTGFATLQHFNTPFCLS